MKRGRTDEADDNDESDPRAETLAKYGWKDDAEREAAVAETAARQKRIDYESAVALARQQQAERKLAAEQAELDRRAEAKRAEEQPEPNRATEMSNTQQSWVDWVRREIRTSQKAQIEPLLLAVGDVLGEYVKALKDQITGETDARQRAEVEVAVVKQELQTLRNELAELRGELKTKSAMADMEARMARLEAPSSPARLKTITG